MLPSTAVISTALLEYVTYYHEGRNYQGKANILLFPSTVTEGNRADAPIGSKGLLSYYHQAA